MVDRGALLSDLQKQVKALEVDLRDQVDTDQKIADPLGEEYDTAFRLGRTAETRRAWEDERITQAAVAWVLGTVFVRFCEDNSLITDRYLAGTTSTDLVVAEEAEAHYFRTDPDPTFRGWLERAFEALAATQAGQSLFDRQHNPLYRIPVSHDGAKALVNFWRRRSEAGELAHRFKSDTWDTRFLGDLYQDLSETAQKRYALLQTPEFVEKFILDRTLTPALEEFGYEHLKLIDPTCGSGHFVLGAFDRIATVWDDQAPGRDRYERVRLALNAVHGVDINPFAVAIARFRLLIAALKKCDISSLDKAKGIDFPLNLVVGDSLIKYREPTLFGATSAEEFAYATEDVLDHPEILASNRYHVVVGNPPYITVHDEKLNKIYRRTYGDVCYRQYALTVPFAKRFFQLAKQPSDDGAGAGYIGQITANSFMKREFGRNLIKYFAAWVNLTEVIDSSGAYIPGHGTPTVILIGRNTNRNRPGTVRVVMGIRGEPSQPEDPSDGLVWRAIVSQIVHPGSESAWVGVADVPRAVLSGHPWAIAGGGAGNLKETLEVRSKQTLSKRIDEIGSGAVTREDSAFMIGAGALNRWGVPEKHRRHIIEGDATRDWAIDGTVESVWPYDPETLEARADSSIRMLLWPVRRLLIERVAYGETQLSRGLNWYEYSMFFQRRYLVPKSIAFAEVATHNHFVLDEGGKVFKQTAPVIKLRKEASEDEHLELLGVLNSSTACFWLKQVCQDKPSNGVKRGLESEKFTVRYQYNAMKMEQLPLPQTYPVERTRLLHQLALRVVALKPAAVTAEGVPTRERLGAAQASYQLVRAQMIAVQEELDWDVYHRYGILDEDLTCADPPPLKLGERAFEIVLARRMAAGDIETQWFARHRSAPVTELPMHWSAGYRALVERRIALIELDRNIGLMERPECKRRWLADSWADMERRALRDWLADQCERREVWYAPDEHGLDQPRPLSVNQLADLLRADDDVLAVAELCEPGRDLAKVLADVLGDEHVPFLTVLRYKPSGLMKRAGWERVWKLQRAEDAAEDEATARKIRDSIPLPQKFGSADFVKTSYWDQRGKLDVPKERFISYLYCGRPVDPSFLLGWAGWNHQEQAQVLATLITQREQVDGWVADMLAPLLAGLREVMPWVRQWHGEVDPEWGVSPAEEYDAFLTETAQRLHLTDEDLAGWRPLEATRARGGRTGQRADNVRS